VIRCDLFLIHLSGNLGSHGICTAATNLGTQRETCAELPSCTAGYSTVPSAVQIRHPVPLGTLPYRRLYRSAILYRWVLYRTVGCTDLPSCTAGYSTVPSAVQIHHLSNSFSVEKVCKLLDINRQVIQWPNDSATDWASDPVVTNLLHSFTIWQTQFQLSIWF